MITTPRPRLAAEILGGALIVGCVGDALLRAPLPGLNVPLTTAAFLVVAAVLARRHAVAVPLEAKLLALVALLFSAGFVMRDAVGLFQLDFLAVALCIALAALSLQGWPIRRLLPDEHARALVRAAIGTGIGAPLLVGHDIRWDVFRSSGQGSGPLRHARAIALGVVLAAPLLLVFGALFASADPVFERLLARAFGWDFDNLASHLVLIGVLTVATAGLLRWTLFVRAPDREGAGRPLAALGIVPVATVLSLLAVLFLVFVIVQLRYFFGGAALVEQTTGLTYAAYAREGFIQLCVASGLTLPIILGASRVVDGEPPAQVRIFRLLAAILLMLLSVIMASAFERVRLYVAAYGLSEIRLYATAFMILLVWVFGWLALTTLRGRGDRFTFGAMMQGLAAIAALHFVNPDAFIMRVNLNRPDAATAFDAKYALSLGADAVPSILDALPRLDPAVRCVAATGLLARWVDNESPADDWRSWNRSRVRAVDLLREQERALRGLACPARVGTDG